jgi:hypothetical protein
MELEGWCASLAGIKSTHIKKVLFRCLIKSSSTTDKETLLNIALGDNDMLNISDTYMLLSLEHEMDEMLKEWKEADKRIQKKLKPLADQGQLHYKQLMYSSILDQLCVTLVKHFRMTQSQISLNDIPLHSNMKNVFYCDYSRNQIHIYNLWFTIKVIPSFVRYEIEHIEIIDSSSETAFDVT